MPRPSSWYLWGAVFTAGFFLILTVQAYIVSLISGVLAIYCIMKWAWKLDAPNELEAVDVGGGVILPTYVSGPTSHGWWAMVITLIVSGMITVMAGFSYVFLWSRRPDLWIAPPDVLTLIGVLALLATCAGAAWFATRATRREGRAWQGLAAGLIVMAAAALTGALLLDMDGTLITSTLAAERVWTRWAERHGLDVAALPSVMHGVRAVDTIRRQNLPDIDLGAEVAWVERGEIEARIESVRGPIGPLNRFQMEEMIDPRDTRAWVCEWVEDAARQAASPERLAPRALGFRP